ncbi:GYD domain-containing protein [Anaeromyxobacter terrae]|uniref:GYD domain-containing protein n=1 Tax=Anaeromyxobacter terrae TaxID=2925406 RepID=UPI001F563981|nr:GYD domain-containing protein [Anaeromyxobacter sp. SG22]
MASYLVLFGFTSKGIEQIKGSPARVEAAKETVRSMGGEVRAFYGIMGSAHDTLFIVDAPNDEAVARMVLAIAGAGFVRTETHRLFTEDEFRKVVRSIP